MLMLQVPEKLFCYLNQSWTLGTRHFTWFWIFSCSSFTSSDPLIPLLILSFGISSMEPCEMAIIRELPQCLLKRIEIQRNSLNFGQKFRQNEWRSYLNSIDSFYHLGDVCGNNIFKWFDFGSIKMAFQTDECALCKQYGESHDAWLFSIK